MKNLRLREDGVYQIRNLQTKHRNARVTGQGYVSYSSKEVQSKVKPETLSCKCPAKCFLSIDEKVIDDNWSYFYSLETKNAQDTYIQTLVEAREVKRRKKLGQDIHNPETSEDGQTFKRNHTYLYNIKINGSLKKVCKNIFMDIYGVSRKTLERICQLLLENKTPKDKRGLKRSGNANPRRCVR